MIKKISAMLLALTITVSAFASCGSSSSSSSSTSSSASSVASDDSTEETTDSDDTTEEVADPSLTIDGEEIDTTDLIICTIDGHDIDFDTFRYYYYYTISLYTSSYGVTIDDIAATDGGFEMLMEDVITQLKQEYVTVHLADENGIELTDEDYEEIDSTIEDVKANFSTEEEYLQQVKASYLTEDLFYKMVELSKLYEKVDETLFENGGKYATSEDDFKEIVQDTNEYARVVSIFIPYECQAEITDEDTLDSYNDMTVSEKYSAKQTAYNDLSDEEQETAKESAKALADEVLEKAQSGEDFFSLIDEYGWDGGMEDSTDGYYLNTNSSFISEYLDAAFALEENEISDLIESSSYGWFIIKRLPVDMDYVEENIDSLISDYDSPKINEVYNDVMDEMSVEYGEYYDKITADSIT